MKFDVFFDIRGPARTEKGVPNKGNPIECDSVIEAMEAVRPFVENTNRPGLVQIVGLRISEARDGS